MLKKNHTSNVKINKKWNDVKQDDGANLIAI